MTKEERISKAVETGKRLQVRDDVCSRSALGGLQEVFDFIPDSVVRASLSLAGGTGAGGGSCGAYCAGLLAVGLKYNSSFEQEAADPEAICPGCAKFVEYRDRFLAEMGTILCPKIHEKVFGRSYDFTDPQQHEAYMNLEGHVEKCADVVGVAVRIAAEMILEDEA